MKIFAVSDLHIDYKENWAWVQQLSQQEYTEDILILAGDISDILQLKEQVFRELARRFYKVVYVPGNHDLWVHRDPINDSITKFEKVLESAANEGVLVEPFHHEGVSIVPLFGWYDYSFGKPSEELIYKWSDFTVCVWPRDFGVEEIHNFFIEKNLPHLGIKNDMVITFSHFMPRRDLMPAYVPHFVKGLLPVMGSHTLEKQIRKLKSHIHIYGHHHLNRQVKLEGTLYVNNAFGYPYETRISQKELLCIHTL